jgi:hypothetical protein
MFLPTASDSSSPKHLKRKLKKRKSNQELI